MSSSSALISVKDLDFAYDSRPVLKRVSFDVAEGDFLGVVGPNGSGKSTLLDLIDGVLEPATGHVRVAERTTRA